MCTEGIVVKCQLMPLIVPQSICLSTSNGHPNQPSVNTQLTLFFCFNNICCKSKKSLSRELMLFTMYITGDDQTKHTQRNRN